MREQGAPVLDPGPGAKTEGGGHGGVRGVGGGLACSDVGKY